MKYELVCGLETHVELKTKSKIFCLCSTGFGSSPNSHCCPVCIGLPGTLPTLNRQVVRFAVMAGLALNCKIETTSQMVRKNYSYPDLPKAYQITQLQNPICRDGFLMLSSGKKIDIERIQIEEDAGKLIHNGDNIYIDYNRAGIPLIEIITKPDINSIDEAKEYVVKLQQIMRYIGVSDCKMQEGSMRCDVNVSLRPVREKSLGTRTEIKNMNSVSNMAKAIEYEYNRQSALLDKGEKVIQETLRFNDTDGSTSPMRSKEDARDYRFFPEPDLLSVNLTFEEMNSLRDSLPELPKEKMDRYINTFELSREDAENLTKYRRIAEYFDRAAVNVRDYKMLSNFMISQIFATFKTEEEKENFQILTSPLELSFLVRLCEEKKINKNLAKITLEKMLKSGKAAEELLSEEDMSSLDEASLISLCKEAIAENKKAVEDYRGGKEKALMVVLGSVMKKSKGKAEGEKALMILKDLVG